ncbi:cobaltochelatase CobT-related protein [Clostridium formicaceticum]|uniref:Cobalamin biosynthesis protein CobT VWA domain protein n=1 Tax=Clostridium formicaceticum TaxID=1497 RepID=A0AAC9RNK7_9CLOT|nr:VWA domain-containing protein [Clostridium formicaceticum]AOY77870.1 nitric oxide reductase activation-like protein [Clostridium formicaceticum]ARE88488.1 Cobalamin biosynthesis protein CobT VWA domain protein [Clostridium formicaceticum]
MKWIYGEYDLENRLTNLMWTICGDYDQELDELEKFTKTSKDLAVYYAAKAGARRKYIDWNMIKKYLKHRIQKGADQDLIVPLVEMCADVMVEEKLIKERPGIEDIRKKGLDDLLERYFKIKLNTFMEKVKYALVLEQMGKHASFDLKVKKLLSDIKKCKDVEDTLALLENIDALYLTHFKEMLENQTFLYEMEEENELKEAYKEEESTKEQSFTSFMYEELYEEDTVISEVVDGMQSSLLIESIGDLKQEVPTNPNENRVLSIDQEMVEKIYKKIEHYHGKSCITKEEQKKIEKKVCRNVHEGCRVHFTEGVLRSPCDNAFQIKYVTRQKEKNLSDFRDNIKVHKRNIMKLKEVIIKTLTAEQEKTIVPSDNGVLAVNKLWRVGRSEKPKVFTKVIDNQKGGYVVDILLDASGSQIARQGKVASQGYIISEALTLAGIPNRVMSFCNFLDYTILRRFRDYTSPQSENQNIFEYFSAGNNRDGLAIQAVSQGLLNRSEENKILIVLSDGKPNDVKISKDNIRTIRGEAFYKGMTAIKDTALEVRKARKNGILLFGVFTGKEEELQAEKLIYGKDFVYTRNIEKFSDIVGTYLKRIIENY